MTVLLHEKQEQKGDSLSSGSLVMSESLQCLGKQTRGRTHRHKLRSGLCTQEHIPAHAVVARAMSIAHVGALLPNVDAV